MARRWPLAVLVAVTSPSVAGCLHESDGTGQTSSQPTTTYATPVATYATPSVTQTQTPPTPAPSPSRYPLDQQQAYATVDAGRAVAGRTPTGEVQIAKTTVMVSELQTRQECDEYDGYSGENRCRTVTESVRVPKTVFLTSGPPGQPAGQYENVAGAFAYAARMGAISEWRLAN